MRTFHRLANELRPISFEKNINVYAEGSCLIKCGKTHVMCTASLEEKVPNWVKGTGGGWITAEYGMLPRSTSLRMEREAKRGQSGRTHEIQRLIGRSLRAVVDLKAMGEVSVKVDCDVLQADGGTRTASVTGGYVALYLALKKMTDSKIIKKFPIIDSVAAISCGVCNGEPVLDLDYEEDATAGTDANFVITGSGKLVEIQGTAEHAPFSVQEFLQLLTLAQKGINEITLLQKQVLED